MDSTTLAAVNLNAVLAALSHLPELDPATAELASEEPLTAQFSSPGVATVRLRFGDGRIAFGRGPGDADLRLLLPTPGAVNAMFAGKGIPVPYRGLRHLPWLTRTFTRATDRLTAYLRPAAGALEDEAFRRINTVLTLHVAAYALAEIGNHDPAGRSITAGMPEGDVQMAVADGPTIYVRNSGGRLSTHPGVSESRRAVMTFTGLEPAGQLLRGEIPTFSVLGAGHIRISGMVPMLNSVNQLLALVPKYLS